MKSINKNSHPKDSLPKANNLKTKTVIIILMLLTITFSNISYRWAMASAWYFNSSYYLSAWSKANSLNDKDEYIAAISAINKAINYNQEHPTYYQAKGRILLWGISYGFEINDESESKSEREGLLKAKALFKKSVSYREAWPEPWVDLANTNYQLEGLSEETQHYLDQALLYGPYNQEVTITTLTLLMASWGSLSSKQTALFYQQLDVALPQSWLASKVFKLSSDYGLSSLLCIQVRYKASLESLRGSWLDKKYCKGK